MLYHHDGRTYEAAASEAADRARTKLNELIEVGRTRAAAVLEKVQTELPEDEVTLQCGLEFRPLPYANGDGELRRLGLVRNETGLSRLHDHALGQACERTDVPLKFARELLAKGAWGTELLAHNLTQISRRREGRLLVRSVRDEVRGILSDKFRRLDSRPLVDAFCQAAQRVGALPIEGYALDTKVAIKAILPAVYEPVPHEVLSFGAIFQNSDFGDGALSVRVFMLRLFCTNYAITDEALRQVHLGGRLPEDIVFSQRTYNLDTDRSASIILDIVGRELAPERIERACELIRQADAEKVSATQVAGFLAKHLNKGEANAVAEAYRSADTENLPAGDTAWRLSNAVSWIAGKTHDEHRRLELEQVAALALPKGGLLHAN